MDVIERELVSGMSQGPTGVVCMFGLPASHATRLAMQSAHAARQATAAACLPVCLFGLPASHATSLAMQSAHAARQATAAAWSPGSSGAPRVRAGQCRPR